MADLSITIRDYLNSASAQLIDVPPLLLFDIDGKFQTAASALDITLSLDDELNYFDIVTDRKVIYRYKSGDTLNGGQINDAKAMYTAVIGIIS
jgi:hypothetical protein